VKASKKTYMRLIALLILHAFLFTSAAYPIEPTYNTTLRVPMKFGNKIDKGTEMFFRILLVELEQVKMAFNFEKIRASFSSLNDKILPENLNYFKTEIETLSPKTKVRIIYHINRLEKEGISLPNLKNIFTMPEFYKNEILAGLDIIPYIRSYGFSLEEINSAEFGKEYELLGKPVKRGDAYIFRLKKDGEEYIVKSEGYDLSFMPVIEFGDYSTGADIKDYYAELESGFDFSNPGSAGSEDRRYFYKRLAGYLFGDLISNEDYFYCKERSGIFADLLFKETGIRAVIMTDESHYWIQTEDGFVVDLFTGGAGTKMPFLLISSIVKNNILVIRKNGEFQTGLEKDIVEAFYKHGTMDDEFTMICKDNGIAMVRKEKLFYLEIFKERESGLKLISENSEYTASDNSSSPREEILVELTANDEDLLQKILNVDGSYIEKRIEGIRIGSKKILALLNKETLALMGYVLYHYQIIDKKIIYLDRIFITQRGRGFARALIESCQNKFLKIYLHNIPDDYNMKVRMENLYIGLGFKEEPSTGVLIWTKKGLRTLLETLMILEDKYSIKTSL
jgi:hypothetical protein